ncbi:MAG: hypothetical protein K2X39_06050, partial [Silvanigrellaceae bacterium]|nr:hypothetical protein [Silvanigrellaceae bacterium]
NKIIEPSSILYSEEIVLIPDIDENLKPKGFFILILDVTDRQRESINFLKAVIDISPDPLSVTDDQNRLLIVNKAFCDKAEKLERELIGYTPHELHTKRLANTIINENNITRKNGSFRSIARPFSNHPADSYVIQKRVFESETLVKYIVCSYQDISEIQNSKTTLQATVRKLKSANENLKNFAHICSHDLQEPARIVFSFANLFSERFKGRIDEEGQKYLHYILDGSYRMQKMIESTLSYTKISIEDHIRTPVSCEALITQILEELKPTIEEFDVTITYDPLPTIIGDHFKLYQLFKNIITNALKFRNKTQPIIHIGVKPYKSGYTFFVKDNGIGINMSFKGSLFKLFGRLNKAEDYPGIGIGLAICKKIVEDYGGKIWIESELGKGTTFYYTIPQKKRLKTE